MKIMQNKYAHNLVIHTLENGMKVLIYPLKTVPRVSIQLWYNVGSKDELTGQKGLAHFLEHMLFKGTRRLSEMDMIQVTNKLSGHCNAFTSHDYTGYIFDFPNTNWQPAFDMLADTMRNCTFKQDLLNSELSAVIQEIKLYKDDYESTLEEEMLGAIFDQHPYHYPVIGYKQELWSASRALMLDFYHTHYIPNNATLVVVGDIDPQAIITGATSYFGHIKADNSYKKEIFYQNFDFKSKSITLYRDIQQPIAMAAFVFPGIQSNNSFMLAIINWIIGSGEGSRLYKKIVEDEQRATHLESHVIDLQDYSLLAIRFYPKNQNDIPTIFETIKKEINLIVEKGLTPDELERAIKQTSMEYFELFEDNDELAHELARLYLATGDPSYVFTYRENEQITTDAIQHYLKKYCNPILMHTGTVSPMHAEDDDYWHQLQEESDELDYRALAHRTRESHLEAGSFVHSITPGYATQTNIKDPSSFTTEQGLKVLYAHRNQTPTVCVLLSLKSDYYYDPQHQQGLNNFVMQLLLTPELSCAFEQCGASIEVQPGGIVINALAQDLQYVLTLLKKMLVHVHFDERHIEKIHAQLRADIHEYWDDAYACIDQLAKEAVYKNHPYAHNALGTVQSIAAITRDDLYAFYQKYITPHGATLAIVGDIATQNVADLLAATGFHEWSGGTIPAIQYPHLAPVQPSIINHPMNRDQVALCFAGISVARTHPDYDALALFDHYMCGGGGGAMSSLLFQIREQTGLFYTIKGSLLAYADKQPGMIMIKTLVSPENLAQTSDQLLDVINNGIRSFSKDHLDIAQQAFIYSLSESLASNYQCAQTYAHLHRFGWSADYFNRRAEQIRAITLDQIQTVVPRYLNSSILTCVTVGRLDQ